MKLELFTTESKAWEKAFLTKYRLDVRLFEELGLKIKQIVPFRSVFQIFTDKGLYCLKKMRFSTEETEYIFEAIEHLRQNGFDNVFNIVRLKNNSFFIEFEGDKYFLTEWIDGRECDYENPVDLINATHTLARMHHASKNFNPKQPLCNRDFLGKWPENFCNRIKDMREIKEQVQSKKEERNEMDALYLAYVDTCLADAEEALGLLTTSSYSELVDVARKEQSFIHHDYAHHNVLHTFEGKTYVVDFDYCIQDIRVHDLGSLIIRNMKKCGWDIDKAKLILDGYNQISPISTKELSVLVPFFLFPQDFWQISKQYYVEQKNWGEQDFLNRMSVKSEYTSMRRKFIEDFCKIH